MPLTKNYYELLEVAPTAPADEIKRAFRAQIARYHPDKVQHLGKEFQEMAADRAAELTEAYRMLSNAGRRAEYDRTLAAASACGAVAAAAPPPSDADRRAPAAPPPRRAEAPPSRARPSQQERASRDEFVRKATIDRFRQALARSAAATTSRSVRGFDIALRARSASCSAAARARACSAGSSRRSTARPWPTPGRWPASGMRRPSDEVCVLLIGSAVAPPRELADAIAEQRRKNRRRRK